MSKLKTALWAVRHPLYALSWAMTRQPYSTHKAARQALSADDAGMNRLDHHALCPARDGELCDCGYEASRSDEGKAAPDVGAAAKTHADCVFCQDVIPNANAGRFQVLGSGVVAFQPLNPVTEGHTLVVPVKHVGDALEDPDVTADVMREAARLAEPWRPCNIITSVGIAATQSVFHLYVHIVPRRPNDGLALPWDSASPDALARAVVDAFGKTKRLQHGIGCSAFMQRICTCGLSELVDAWVAATANTEGAES